MVHMVDADKSNTSETFIFFNYETILFLSTHSFNKQFPLHKTQIQAIILHSTNSGNVSTSIFHGYLSTRMKTSSSYCLFNGTCRFYCLIFGGFLFTAVRMGKKPYIYIFLKSITSIRACYEAKP